jgi:hypothetical protein
MLGDVYIIDLNDFLPNGDYLDQSDTYSNIGILVQVNPNYFTGFSKCKFFIKGGI